ncbi:MAG: hypothetical protein O9282_03180, partial [Flavobacterium sp.]|uniref:hypothetical protein n=1 Tax=Flavobacterium sp. TaxID=239 RepID=UPI0022C34EFE
KLVCFLALIEVEILYFLIATGLNPWQFKKKDCNEKQENGLLKKPECFAPYPNQIGIDSEI